MSYKRIFWGLILITIGILFILKNLDIVFFSWSTIWRLWPVLLILWGISIIPENFLRNWMKLVLSILAIALAFTFISNRPAYKHEFRAHKFFDESKFEDQQISLPYDTMLSEVFLSLDAAAGNFKIKSSTDELIEFNKYGVLGDYSITSNDVDSKKHINIKLENTVINFKNKSDKVEIKLNPEPVWDFDMDIGAASFNLDLSKFMVQELNIDGGAASIKIKLGDKYHTTNLNIDAGASSIRIVIPEESGCEIKTSTVLSSRSFKGFKKLKDHTYQTGNFEDSDNKIYIDLDAAVSSMTIIRN